MHKPVMLFACEGVDPEPWIGGLAELLPELEVRVWPNSGRREAIDYAFLWKPPAGALDGLSGLKAVFSYGAGVEPLLEPGLVPPDVPLIRMVDPSLAIGMREFVAMQVLHYHRRMHEHMDYQRQSRWVPLVPKLPEDRVVGILGLGELGGACADALVRFDFDVRGWSRTPRERSGVRVFHGDDGLAAFLNGVEILVCLLPLTPETQGILNAKLFAALPRGACVINVARGGHLVDSDLLAALASGHIAGATLDVFNTEPLPPDHVFWRTPNVTVVPHCSAVTQPASAIKTLARNLRDHMEGRPLAHIVDRGRGY